MFDFIRKFTKSAAEKRQERLNAYLDGALSGQDRSRFEQELDRDADLRAELEQLRWVKLSVQELPRVRAPRNFVLDPAVYGQIQSAPAVWNFYPSLRVATALTAFFFILALALDVATPYGALRQPLAGISAPQSVADQDGEALATEEMELAAEAPREEAVEDDGAADMAPFAATVTAEESAEPEAAMAVEEAGEAAAEGETRDEAATNVEVTRVVTEEIVEEPQAEEEAVEEPAPLLVVTESPSEVAAAESADTDATASTPDGFPFLLAIEIVLVVAFVVLFATTIIARRNV